MAVNNEYFPNMGVLWSRIITLWTTWVQQPGVSWSISIFPDPNYRVYDIAQSFGPTTNNFRLWDFGMPIASKYKADALRITPGWMTTPGVLTPNYGARVPGTEFISVLQPTRDFIWATATNAAQVSSTGSSYAFGPPGCTVHYQAATYTDGFVVLGDWLTLTTFQQLGISLFPNSTNPAISAPNAPMPVVGSGGAAQDLTPIVEALNDIALIDVEYTANNGGAIWSMRGKVRTP